MGRMGLAIHLRDLNGELIRAWRRAFSGVRGLEVSQGDIFARPRASGRTSPDALVSPANSFGIMDGGIDRVYSEYFGWKLHIRLQDRIAREHRGELPVGQALVIATKHKTIPWLVSAPTMREPGDVSETDNAYLAFRAALRAALRFNRQEKKRPIHSLMCPGMCTAAGRMPVERCARQMRRAYDEVFPRSG